MGVHVGFYKTLLKMGKWRFGIGYKVKGAAGFAMLCVCGVLNLMWLIVLGCFWAMYGVIYLCFILPVKGIVRLCKKKKGKNLNQGTTANNITVGGK